MFAYDMHVLGNDDYMKNLKKFRKMALSAGLLLGLGGVAFSSIVALKNVDVSKPVEAAIGNEVVFEVSSLSELAFVQPSNNSLPGWAIALIVIGAVLLFGLFCYVLLFSVFAKWTDKDNEAKRVTIVGKRDETKKVMFMNLKTAYRIESRSFKTKDEADEAIKNR